MHGIQTEAEVEMISSGTQKVTVQYSGPDNQMPTEVPIMLWSSAHAFFSSVRSGSASADNGIGDPEEWINEGPLLMVGCKSFGKHLRFVKLNAAGYGELSFSSSATATQSGYNASVVAVAQSASAIKDNRDISLIAPTFPGPFFKAGAKQSGTIGWVVNYGSVSPGSPNVTITRTFNKKFSIPEPAESGSTALFSRFTKAIIGLLRTESEVDDYNPLHQKSNVSLAGTSVFPDAPIFNRHGIYKWDIEERTWTLSIPPSPPLTGELPATISASKIDSSTIFKPHNCLIPKSEPWGPTTLEYDHSHEGTAGKIHNHKYSVEWADGVNGEAALEIEYRSSGEEQDVTSEQNFRPPTSSQPSLPYHLMHPVGGTPQFYNDWISGSISSTNFWIYETPMWLKWAITNRPVAKLGTELLKAVPVRDPILGASVKTTSAFLDFTIDSTAKNESRTVSRSAAHILTTHAGNYGGGTPLLDLWNEQPGLFMYRMYAEPAYWASNVSSDHYGLNGFQGSECSLNIQLESDEQAVHWIEISWAQNGVPSE